MTIRDLITQEAAALRKTAADGLQSAKTSAEGMIQAAQNDSDKLEAKAVALEKKLESIPSEIEALAEESAQNVWTWIFGK